MKCALLKIFFFFFYMTANYLYSWFLVFVQALHLYCYVVISNTFNLIFEADLLCDSINESFLEIKLSASPALHQATPIIAVTTQINARFRLTV